MPTLQTIAGKKVCGGQSDINTGKLGCLVDLSSIEHFIAVKKGTTIPKETVIDVDYITEQVQKGFWLPVLGASNFEDVSAEDAYNTNPSGVKRLNLQGLPEYRLMYEEGHEFYKEISKISSYKSYDFILIDDKGAWAIVVNANGDYKGYTMGHVTAEMTKRKVKGGENESKSILFQFLDRLEYDLNYEIFQASEIGLYPSDIKTVNGVHLTYNELPSNTDTTLSINVTLSSDENTIVEGLTTITDWLVEVDGTAAVISSITEPTPGNYVLTIPALSTGEEVTVQTWDDALGTTAILSGDILYRSKVLTETVIA